MKPLTEAERSIIFKWGVRIECVDGGKSVTVWICHADAVCRENPAVLVLSWGRTSKAT